MHSDYARQGTRILKVARELGGLEVMAEAETPEHAEEILRALQRVDLDSDMAGAIRQALGDFSFETRRYISSSMASISREKDHLKECPDCQHSHARLQTESEILDALQRRQDGIADAYDLYARDGDEHPTGGQD